MKRAIRFLVATIFLTGCTPMDETTPPANTPTPVELTGTWQLVELKGQPFSKLVTLEFGPNSNVSGEGPCNRYFGTYAAASDFSFSLPQIGSTKRACPDLSDEIVYFDALSKAAQYRPGREGDTFALLDDTGTMTLASYIRAQPFDIVGAWQVSSVLIDNGLQSGPELSGVGLNFTNNGGFSGNLGCNNVSGQYDLRAENLSFDAVAVTARACFAPAPYEGPILSHLSNVTSITQSSTSFQMLNAAGQTLITLSR